LTASSSGSS